MAPGGVKLLIAIESPRGLLNAAAIAACSPRVCGLMFGAEDFGRELGLPTSREGEARDMLYARSAMVIAAAAAHVQAVDGVWVDLKDTDGLAGFARQSRRLGFSGMSSIHPSQIDPINSHLQSDAAGGELCRASRQGFEEANARGDGSIALGGQLIDRPIVERARRTLEMAQSLGIFRLYRGQKNEHKVSLMKQKAFGRTHVRLALRGAATPGRMTPVKVAEGVYMFEHSRGSGNSTVVFTEDGVLVFDFAIDNADQTLAAIRKMTDKKVKYLISSHSAGDHASGAWHFREDKPVWIATKNQIHDLRMQEAKEFNERKNSNDPRNAAYKKVSRRRLILDLKVT